MNINFEQYHSIQMAYRIAQRLICLKYSNQGEDYIRQALQNLKESYNEGRFTCWSITMTSLCDTQKRWVFLYDSQGEFTGFHWFLIHKHILTRWNKITRNYEFIYLYFGRTTLENLQLFVSKKLRYPFNFLFSQNGRRIFCSLAWLALHGNSYIFIALTGYVRWPHK